MSKIPKTDELFDLSHSIAEPLLEECEYPFLAISKIRNFISECALRLDRSYREIERGVFVADDARVWQGATLSAPTIIGHGAEIRPGAFIRGGVIVGDGAVIGNSSEVKNSIIFDEAKLPHYNYVGDSIIGFRAHLGAGAVCSNLRLDKRPIRHFSDGESMETGMSKLGGMIADYAEIGCGAVVLPGAIICREALVYPLVRIGGCLGERCIFDGNGITYKNGG